jgi:mannosyltransferase PIG-V
MPGVRGVTVVFLLWWAWVLLFTLGALLLFGAEPPGPPSVEALPLVRPFSGALSDLASVWAHWDSASYLEIADHGYSRFGSEAFFPLYPLASRGLGEIGDVLLTQQQGVLLAATAISQAAFGAALYFLYRLTELELDREIAWLAICLLAFFPMSVFFAVAYSESLFLLLSVASFWFARTDRWAAAGICGALAAATRSAGVVLVVPLLALYLLGPRGRGETARPYLGVPWRGGARLRTYALMPNALWILVIPLGVVAYAAFLGISEGDPLRFASIQADAWHRPFGELGGIPLGPVAGLARGAGAAFTGVKDIAADLSLATVWAPHQGLSLARAGINVEAFLFLVAGLIATAGVLRRLPLAYGAYAVAALLLPLSYPATISFYVPLFSMPRFLAVIFPLFIWLALIVRERGWQRPALVLSAGLLALYAAQWGTEQWVS